MKYKCETLRLRLHANKDPHAEDDAEETQDERTLPMAQESESPMRSVGVTVCLLDFVLIFLRFCA